LAKRNDRTVEKTDPRPTKFVLALGYNHLCWIPIDLAGTSKNVKQVVAIIVIAPRRILALFRGRYIGVIMKFTGSVTSTTKK
jgi:hypothetical protein